MTEGGSPIKGAADGRPPGRGPSLLFPTLIHCLVRFCRYCILYLEVFLAQFVGLGAKITFQKRQTNKKAKVPSEPSPSTQGSQNGLIISICAMINMPTVSEESAQATPLKQGAKDRVWQ